MGQLKPGLKLSSAVCSAEVMVIKAGGDAELTCGGVPMAGPGESSGGAEADQALMTGCQIGKRYVNEDQSVEILCVKGGDGTLAVNGTPLVIKEAKKLPSSD